MQQVINMVSQHENYDEGEEMAEWEFVQMCNVKSPSTQNYSLIATSIEVAFF